MRKGKKSSFFNEPILHTIVAVAGLAIIIFMPDAAQVCEKYKKAVSISTDIGIGLFPTGLIGLILVFMQKSQKSNERFDNRVSLLKDLDMYLRNLLNELCKLAANSQTRGGEVKDLLTQLHDVDESITFDRSIKECAFLFSKQVDMFLLNKTDYLLTEIFTSDEMDALSLLSENIREVIDTIDNENGFQRKRCIDDMISCILKLLKKIPEFTPYLKQKYSGSHIQ